MAGPTLKDIRGTKKITLSDYPDSEVEVYDGVLVADYPVVQDIVKDTENVEKIIKALVVMIKGWNFTNEAGEALPVNEENIGKLAASALLEIANTIAEAIDAKKKATST